MDQFQSEWEKELVSSPTNREILPDLLDRIYDRINKKATKKWTPLIVISCTVLAFASIALTTSSFAKDEILNVLTNFTTGSGGGQITGILFKGGGSSGAFDGPVVDSIQTNRYTDDLQRVVGINFPKLNHPDLEITNTSASIFNRDRQQLEVEASASIPGTGLLRLFLYRNTVKQLWIGGTTLKPSGNSTIDLNGISATYVAVHPVSYLAWKRDGWTIILEGTNIPKSMLLEIGNHLDQQAQGS